MAHIRMKAPRGHLSVNVGGITYQIDPDGEFDAHEQHKPALLAQGYVQKASRAHLDLDGVHAQQAFAAKNGELFRTHEEAALRNAELTRLEEFKASEAAQGLSDQVEKAVTQEAGAASEPF